MRRGLTFCRHHRHLHRPARRSRDIACVQVQLRSTTLLGSPYYLLSLGQSARSDINISLSTRKWYAHVASNQMATGADEAVSEDLGDPSRHWPHLYCPTNSVLITHYFGHAEHIADGTLLAMRMGWPNDFRSVHRAYLDAHRPIDRSP